jgi:hypothetical protein
MEACARLHGTVGGEALPIEAVGITSVSEEATMKVNFLSVR